MSIRILLVEDEPAWQQGIAALLSVESDLELVHTVDNADEAEVWFDAERPDIVLLDWKIKGPRDGLDVAAVLVQQIAPARLILVTGSPADQLPEHPYGYVPKPQIASELIPAIRAAMTVDAEPANSNDTADLRI